MSSVVEDKAGNGVQMVLKIMIRDLVLDLRSWGVWRWGHVTFLIGSHIGEKC